MLACFLLVQFRAVAQDEEDPGHRFEHLTVEDGLSHNGVYTIMQDHHGFLWFGTENGLNMYDGNNFIRFEHDPRDSLSLSDAWVTALFEDSAGSIWVGTRSGGLNRLERREKTFFRYPQQACTGTSCASSALPRGAVSAIIQDEKGSLWIGTMGGGLSRLDPRTDEFTHFRHDPTDPQSISSNRVWSLTPTRDGQLWIGTWDGGLNVLDTHTLVFRRYGRDTYGGLSSERIRAVLEDRLGQVWIGTSGGGLNRFDTARESMDVFRSDPADPQSLSDDKVWALFEDSRGVLWVGTYDGGLNRYDRRSGAFRRYEYDESNPDGISGTVISDLFEDRSGILWIATERGLSRYNLAQERHRHYTYEQGSLSHSDVLAIEPSRADPSKLWIGTGGGGLNGYDTRDGSFVHYVYRDDRNGDRRENIIAAVAEDHDGVLWLGTLGAGLIRLDPVKGVFEDVWRKSPQRSSLAMASVLATHVDSQNRIWIGTDGGGLARYDRETGTFQRFKYDPFDAKGLSDGSVQTIFEDRQGRIWIGTVNGGLNLLDQERGIFIRYQHSPSDSSTISHNRIAAIHEDPVGDLWIGTYGGLNRLQPETHEVVRYSRRHGIPDDPVVSITSDTAGTLWLTSTGRLTRFDPPRSSVRHYNERNGLSANHYSSGALVAGPGGDIYIGGSNGFSRFRPPNPERKTFVPPIVVTSFRKMDQEIARELFSGQSVKLSHRDKFFTLEFAVLDYTNPKKHQYRFKLDEYDTEWHEMTGPIGRASYANFAPRRERFVFRLEGVNSEGVGNSLWLSVHVIPPFWQTLWFRLSSALAVVLIGGSLAALRYSRLQKEKAETLRLLAEGRESERQYLARELHDVPLQNLYSVRHKLEVLSRTMMNGEGAELLEDVHSVVERTAEELRILCGELRPPSLGPFGLEKAIRAHMRTIHRSHPDLEVLLRLTPDAQELPEPTRQALFRIYQGALTNVIRHANATRLTVRFDLRDTDIMLEIEDNGRGFHVPKSWLTLARSRHFGLLGLSEWADAIQGELTVRSAPGRGTTVRVVAPRPKFRSSNGRASLLG